MNTENTESDPGEITLGNLIWLYAKDESDQFYPLLESLIDNRQFATAIELLKVRALNQIHGDLDAIAVEGIGTHIQKLAIALNHIDDYGIDKRLDS